MSRNAQFIGISLAVGLLSAIGGSARAEERESQQAALAALQVFDPIVQMGQTKPDRPVVGIQFRPNIPQKVADADLVHLQAFPSLRVLELSSNPITDAGLAHLAPLNQLEELNLNWNHVTAAGVVRLVKSRTKLQRLEASGVPLGDEHLAQLNGLTELRILGLRGSLVTDRGLAQLAPFTKLRKLSLMGTGIGDAGLEHLKGLTELEDLDLDRTAITDAGLVYLSALHNLRRLQFAHTAVTDAGLVHLEQLSNLKSLNVGGTKVTQAGVDKVKPGLAQVHDVQSDVLKEQVTGGIAFPPKDRQWTRITGIVNVLNAHTLLYEDGTQVDLNDGMEAPELEQQGLIGGKLYPCGREAAGFLRSLIGNQKVTCIAGREHVDGKKIHVASAYVGETNLNIEMIRGGWAISHHSGMDAWEIIARENKRGLWRGEFVLPEKWRKGERLPGETESRQPPSTAEQLKSSERVTAGADDIHRAPTVQAANPKQNDGKAPLLREPKTGPARRITGKVRVIDAHTLVFEDGTEVEINGVMDAPDPAQMGRIGEALYPCGQGATEFLRKLIGDEAVTFLAFGAKSSWSNKPFGNCYAGEVFIQEAMVRNGWAVSGHSAMTLAQLVAQESKRGLWRGDFVEPEKWRKGERLKGE